MYTYIYMQIHNRSDQRSSSLLLYLLTYILHTALTNFGIDVRSMLDVKKLQHVVYLVIIVYFIHSFRFVILEVCTNII